MRIKYILSNLAISVLGLFFACQPALAQMEFDTSGRVIYEVGPRGTGTASQEIKLTNNFSHIYPKEYQLEIVGNKIQNIQAEDSQGNILNKVQEAGSKTIINLLFNETNVGKDKITDFTINYDIPNLAVKKGQIWEMSIPRLANSKDFDDFNLVIKVPDAFGSLSYSSVNPFSEEITNNQLILNYQRTQLGENPILLAFGEFQIFNFDLDFTLTNSQNQTVNKVIPIPPDTSYQSVFLTDISPRPVKIYADEDYNWLALYEINPGEAVEINVKGQAKIFGEAENKNFASLHKNKPMDNYLKTDEYWQVSSPIIQDLKDYFTTPSQIYDFVVDHLEYDYENLQESERLGAVKAYQEKKGVCTEFSDLFVTLARANGIPARELEGFAFTDNKELFTLAAENDVLHSWVEYWDSGQELWLPADPTWAKTTEGIDFINNFDLGHFAFVIHGMSSTKPIPPGFYKNGLSQNKNVNVEFAKKLLPKPDPNLTVEWEIVDDKPQVIIKNDALSAEYNVTITLQDWKNNDLLKSNIGIFPPLGSAAYDIEPPGFWAKLFGNPSYQVIVNQETHKLDYPVGKLNFLDFFANLWSSLRK